MEALAKKRRAARGWVTRETNRLSTVLQKELCEVTDIQRGLEDLKIRIERLDNVQGEVELVLEDDILDNDIEESFKFLEDSREVIRLAEQRISVLTPTTQPVNAPSQCSAHSVDGDTDNRRRSSPLGAQLPKLQLPKFSGNYIDWTEFWDKFSAVIDASEIPTINKFSYLQSLLTGEALATIKGLSLTEANYNIAVALLKERYGRKERIILSHLQRLLNIEIPNVKVVAKLWQVYNELQSNIRSLENLGVNGVEYGIVLTPLVLSRLPQEFRLEWARFSEGREGDLIWLLDFFKNEISRRERSETYQKASPLEQQKGREPRTPSAAVLQTSGYTAKCVFCGKQHPSMKCWNLKSMPVADVKSILKDKNLCFRCFGDSHQARACKVNCSICSGRHNRLFCYNSNSSLSRNPDHTVSSVSGGTDSNTNSDSSRTDNVYYHTSKLTNKTTTMQTLTVFVNDVPCNFLFDSGSDKSYVTSSFVKRVKPRYIGNENVSHVCFGERGPRNPTKRNVFELKCRMTNGDFKPLIVTEIPMITTPLFRPKLPKDILDEFAVIDPHSLKQSFNKDENISIDVLIGLDFYWQVMTPNLLRLKSSTGLVAQESVFGWILAGSYPTQKRGIGPHRSDLHRQHLCLTDISDKVVRKFWELDSLGISVGEEKVEDKALCSFNETIRLVDGRYEVELPWKKDSKSLLENNLESAKLRLVSLNRKLDRDPDLKSRYNAALSALEEEGIFEEVPDNEIDNKGNPVFYLPHRPVIKESSSTTKLRPVFDASARDKNGLSLNDCMKSGPNLIGNLLDILLRFRRWKYALSGDITKAFFQIQVNRVDQNVHRFLWKDGGILRIMRITRVPFGNTASPFLLNATLKYHLSQQLSSRVVEELLSNLYVDDWLTGADTVKEVEQLKSDAKVIMDNAHMPLTKWCSNSIVVADQDIQLLREKDVEVDQHKVLGILWVSKEDCFSFTDFDLDLNDLVVTRRIVLSCISRIFDPMGFLQPFIMVAKILFQGLWKFGLQWDESVPKEEETKFLSWIQQLSRLKEFCIPRCFVRLSWENKRAIELHAFGDASEKGYGACVYLKVLEENETITTSLVIAKAKLAPIKKVTLPRLELLGALLCARLITHVRRALCLPETTKCKCWTDSTVTLQWIQSDASRWKTFVSNRVSEIQELTSPDSWAHCPGVENPADILSRGVMLDTLLCSQQWLHGPSWLSNRDHFDNIDANLNVDGKDESEFITDEHVDCSVQLSVATHFDPIFPVERWGDFSKAVRICAYVLRFVNNLKCVKTRGSRISGHSALDEFEQAYIKILAETQRQYFGPEILDLKRGKGVSRSSLLFKMMPFIGEDGLLRMKGRLQFSDLSFNEKHPVILPNCHIAFLLCRREHKMLHHAGVAQMITSLRNKFWIVKLRSIAKRVKRECVACTRYDARLPHQELSPMPRDRIVRSNPFSVAGVDFAGPLFAADFVGKKFYILLFTCAVIRAVHIELVASLSLSDFLLAFRRFVARRGMPSLIISDNAKTFKSAAEILKRELAEQGPRWQFITPRAPWFGGFWERLIKSTKLCLRKTLGLRTLTRAELETTLHQVEACINSRPLTTVYDVIECDEPLTPSHFLLGRGDGHRSENNGIAPSLDNITGQELRQLLLLKGAQLRKFWNMWQKEYIRNLPLVKQSGTHKDVFEGMLCLVKEDNVSRMHWPLAKITQVFPGKDGVIRSVQVKMGKGYLTRPVNKICCLEILKEDVRNNAQISTDEHSEGETEETKCQTKSPLYVSRAGRVVKPTERF